MAQSTIRDSGFEVALNVLRRRKWVGAIAFVTALSLAAPFAVFLPDVYRGVTTVLVENQDSSSPLVRAGVPELETRLVTIEQELLSRGLLSELIAKQGLYNNWRRRGASMESVVDRMRRDIHVEASRTDRGRPTTIGLKISYIGLDPKSAAAVPNALATLYVEENTRMRERHTADMAGFLKAQLEKTAQVVAQQQERINQFKQVHAGMLPEEMSFNMVTLERLNLQLRMNSDDQLKQQERLAATPAPAAPDSLTALKQKLAELQSRFTDKHPDVIHLKEQIADLERQRAISDAVRQPAAARTDAKTNALASLRREEVQLRSDIASYEHRIQAAPQVEQELEGLKRDYEAAKESHESILKRYEEAQLADRLEQTKAAETFRILDAAIVPTFPAAPNRMRLLVMAVFFAFAACAGAMLFAEHLDTSFHTVGDLRRFTTLPVFACIPDMPKRPTLLGVARVVFTVIAVIGLCALLAATAYRTARENTQLVWMVSAPQV
jgi:succinoglycan biosynthesis transport protein ExoP